jgi:hypothetical protein
MSWGILPKRFPPVALPKYWGDMGRNGKPDVDPRIVVADSRVDVQPKQDRDAQLLLKTRIAESKA